MGDSIVFLRTANSTSKTPNETTLFPWSFKESTKGQEAYYGRIVRSEVKASVQDMGRVFIF